MSNVELEDVGDSVGLSCRLPSLANVKVDHKDKHVVITAYRAGSALCASNAQKVAKGPKSVTLKFELVSSKDANDVAYEYDCESGYLHIFLDGIKLAKLSKSQRDDTMKSLRKRFANSVADKLSSLKKAVVRDATPDLSLQGLAIKPESF